MARRDLRTLFDELPDHRVKRTRKHALVDIVLLTLVATIQGVEGWDEIHLFGVCRLEQLRPLLRLKNGVPSADTLRRVIGGLDSAAFRGVFIEWLAQLVRGHWQIENNLHWVLDVTFGEDHARVSRKHGAENLALIRKTAMNLLHKAPAPHKSATSLPQKRLWANSRIEYLTEILSSGLEA